MSTLLPSLLKLNTETRNQKPSRDGQRHVARNLEL